MVIHAMEACSSKSLTGLFWKNGNERGNLELGVGVLFYSINQCIFDHILLFRKKMFWALTLNISLIHLKIKYMPV